MLVENNECNLHIYGTHCNAVVIKGNAVVYGYYGNVTVMGDGEVEAHGSYKSINSSKE